MKNFFVNVRSRNAGKVQRVSGVKRRGSFFIFSILPVIFGALLVGVIIKPVHADPLPVTHVTGTLSSDQTWTSDHVYVVDDTVTVPDGKTLTIDAGTIVKYHNADYSGNNNKGIMIDEGAVLDAGGTSNAPIIFTGYRDDSAGGDSNGDGSSSSGVNDFSQALVNNAGSINIVHAEFRGGSYGSVTTDCGVANSIVADNVFKAGVRVSDCGGTTLSMQRNHFDVSNDYNGYGLSASSNMSGILLDGNDKNVFTGNARGLAVHLYDSRVEAGQTWTIAADSGAVIDIAQDQQLKVAGTLNLYSGAIIKMNVTNWSRNPGIRIEDTGTVNTSGSSSSPVVFTSYKDDSAGGDTNGDGSSTGSMNDYYATLDNQHGGTLNAAHAEFRFGVGTAVEVACSNTTLTDSLLKGNFSLSGCTGDSVTLQRNRFELPNDYPYGAIAASTDHWANIAFTGENKNVFVGSDKQVMVSLDDGVNSGQALTLSSEGGVVFQTQQFEVKGTLDVNPGTIIKFNTYRGQQWPPQEPGLHVFNGGTLNLNGTSSSNIKLTSTEDDTVGGDTTNDGNTTGQAGDYYSAITLQDGSTLNATYVDIAYATKSLYAYGGHSFLSNATIHDASQSGMLVNGGLIVFRGTFNNDSTDIQACNWGQEGCEVDAAYTDWGNGVDPTAAPTKACGSVWVYPWVGNPPSQNSTPYIPNCGGGSTPSDDMNTSANNLNNALADDYSNCEEVDPDSPPCQVIHITRTCLSSALQTAEDNATIGGFPAVDPLDTSTYTSGAISLVENYVESHTVMSPTQFAGGVTAEMGGGALAILSIKGAYDTCLSSAEQ